MLARRLMNTSLKVLGTQLHTVSAPTAAKFIPAICNTIQPKRTFLFESWLNMIFNKFDETRIDDVGPDRACAEWLLRVGASVKWKGKEIPITDYNSLPVGQFRTLFVEAIDATDSGIMEAGFPYLKLIQHFRKIKLRNCK